MDIQSLERVLKAHAFFSTFSDEHIQLLTGCASNQIFQKGEFLIRKDSEATHFFLLRSGRVAIDLHVPSRGQVTTQTITTDDILGWSWLIPPYHYDFDGRALEQTRVIALDAVCLRDKCEKDAELGYTLLKTFAGEMTKRLQATRLQLLDMYGIPSR